MSSLSETITHNILEDDDREITSSSFSVFADSSYIIAPKIDVSVNTKGIPSEASLINSGGGYQWHLNDTWGVNAHEVWEEYTGQGVRVAVFDDGFDYNHSDLSANYNTSLDFDTAGGNDNDAIHDFNDRHGTAVAGVIAADDNGTGQVGVAFDAELVGIRRDFSETSFTSTVEGFEFALTSGADVMNNSWGATTLFADHPTRNYFGDDTTEVLDAIIDLVDQGRGGLGTSVVFSAGNSRGTDDNVNYHGYQNSPYTITVAGSDINGELYSGSTEGSAILVTAGAVGITTTDASGSDGYTGSDSVYINGTSFSAPTVSGVIALMYEANSDLGYRDVQEILAMSSRQLNDSGWQTNGATNWNGGGMHFSHDYGYGLVDAYTAVRLAETWGGEQKTYDNIQTVSVSGTPNVAIPDNSTLQHTITVTDDISIEHVVLDVAIPHQRAGDLIVTLISPDGTESILAETPGAGGLITDVHGYTGISFQFSSTAHWGEESAGDWTLRIRDTKGSNVGTLESFNLEFIGSTITEDNTYYFTDEFQEALIADNVGNDTLNLAAVRSDVTLVLSGGGTSNIVPGENLRLSNASVIENAYLGDGNDTIYGNDADNIIFAGRGDDMIFTSAGNDTIDGESGYDQVTLDGNFDNYTIEFLDALTVRITDNLGGDGVDVVTNVENFIFNDQILTLVELETEIENPPTADPILIRFDWDGNRSFYTSSIVEARNLSATELGITDASGNLVFLDRDITSLDLDILNPVAQDIESVTVIFGDALNFSLDGARATNIQLGSSTSSSVNLTNTMSGRVETGDGSDVINIMLTELVTPVSTENYRIIANDGNDQITVTGTHSNSRVQAFGGTGNDTITVTVVGDHFLYGGAGDDVINGSDGNERIEGEGGSDIINAGGGDDTVYGGDLNDVIDGGAGNDFLYGDSGSDVLNGGAGDDNIRGGIGVDTLNGGTGSDVLYGQDGNDLLNGGDSRDYLYGGTGDDAINGDDGNDLIYGEAGNDTINGGDGNDEILAGADDDTVFGGLGQDRLLGGTGNDEIRGGADKDVIHGEDGDDILYGDDAVDRLFGGNGDDFLIGGSGQDFLFGGNGADTFTLDNMNVDRVRDFQIADGDRIDIADLLTGFNFVTDDINDFVEIIIRGTTRTDFYVNSDGAGNDFQQVGIVFGNFTGQTVDTLYANGDILA